MTGDAANRRCQLSHLTLGQSVVENLQQTGEEVGADAVNARHPRDWQLAPLDDSVRELHTVCGRWIGDGTSRWGGVALSWRREVILKI